MSSPIEIRTQAFRGGDLTAKKALTHGILLGKEEDPLSSSFPAGRGTGWKGCEGRGTASLLALSRTKGWHIPMEISMLRAPLLRRTAT